MGQEDVQLRGHAIECRINAEDVANGFLPAPGRITAYREPSGPGIRVDSGVVAGSEISGFYDPMIAKLIVHGVDREHARLRMLRALDEFELAGTPTLLGFHRALLSHPCFIAGETCHGIVESEAIAVRAGELTREAPQARSANGRILPRVTAVEVGGRRYDVTVLAPEPPWAELARRRRGRAAHGPGAGSEAVVTPMQGTVLKVEVAEGDEIEAGKVVCVVEAMKMENEIVAHRSGTVSGLSVVAGDAVSSGQVICLVLAV
jgi:acetyl-CoA/propionyl-CoA carboxylase, biotin carboxylase, biotin carboxyl carrier protein